MKPTESKLRKKIEDALVKLMSGAAAKMTEPEKEELRKNCLLAIKWEAVRAKTEGQDWGAGFGNDPDLGDDENDGLDS